MPRREKATKDVGRGVRLPLYLRGRDSVGWWAMCITMLAVFTAFVSVLFGYFFYWTLDARFLDEAARGPAVDRPLTAVGLTAVSWAGTLAARTWNAADRRIAFYGAIGLAVAAAVWAVVACWNAAARSASRESIPIRELRVSTKSSNMNSAAMKSAATRRPSRSSRR